MTEVTTAVVNDMGRTDRGKTKTLNQLKWRCSVCQANSFTMETSAPL